MPKPEDMTRLNQHILSSTVASAGAFLVGVIGLLLYLNPGIAGVDSGDTDLERTVWLVMGLILTIGGIVFLLILAQWPGLLKRTVLRTIPRPMMVKIEVTQSCDCTTYYALLSEKEDTIMKTPIWRVCIWIQPPDVRRDTGRQMEGSVYFNAKTGWPVAIEVSKGVLWGMAGSGAVEKLSD